MSFKLYDGPFPGTRGTRVRWMLEEANAKYDVAPLDFRAGEHKREPYLSIHPHGLVPGAQVDGETFIESAAMCLHLADTHPSAGLAPAVGSITRAYYYQWITYAVATLDPALVPAILNAAVLPPDRRDPSKVEAGKKLWDVAGAFLERALEGKTWICGEAFSAADVVLGYDVAMAKQLGWVADGTRVGAYAARLMGRPAFQKAYGG